MNLLVGHSRCQRDGSIAFGSRTGWPSVNFMQGRALFVGPFTTPGHPPDSAPPPDADDSSSALSGPITPPGHPPAPVTPPERDNSTVASSGPSTPAGTPPVTPPEVAPVGLGLELVLFLSRG